MSLSATTCKPGMAAIRVRQKREAPQIAPMKPFSAAPALRKTALA